MHKLQFCLSDHFDTTSYRPQQPWWVSGVVAQRYTTRGFTAACSTPSRLMFSLFHRCAPRLRFAARCSLANYTARHIGNRHACVGRDRRRNATWPLALQSLWCRTNRPLSDRLDRRSLHIHRQRSLSAQEVFAFSEELFLSYRHKKLPIVYRYISTTEYKYTKSDQRTVTHNYINYCEEHHSKIPKLKSEF